MGTDFFDEKDSILIQVSSFRDQKDQPTLIKSLTHLPDNIKLLLVGDGPERDKMERLCRDLDIFDDVRFLGKLEAVEIAPLHFTRGKATYNTQKPLADYPDIRVMLWDNLISPLCSLYQK